MRKSLFARFDRIMIADQDYRFQSQDKQGVFLERCDVSGAIERFSYEEIEQHKEAGRWSYDREYFKGNNSLEKPGRAKSKLSTLDKNKLGLVTYRATICGVVRDLHDAGEITLREPSLNEKRHLIEALVNEREISRHSLGAKLRGGSPLPVRKLPCSRTILEYYRIWRNGDCSIEKLIPKLGQYRKSTISADHEKEEFLRKCIMRFASKDRPSMELVIHHTTEQFDLENLRRRTAGEREIGSVSASTVRRRINRMDPFLVTYHRQGAEVARRQFSSYGAGLQVLNPMERIEIDEWKCNIRNLFGKLGIAGVLPAHVLEKIPKGRRWVCSAIDCATRSILGLRVAEAPSSVEARRLLRMVVTDKSELAKSLGLRNQWPQFGGLCTVATDAGSAFHSNDFQVAVQNLHGYPNTPPLEKSELRGTKERLYGSFDTGIMPYLPGQTFSNIQEKGDYNSDESAVLDDNDLAAILVSWVVDYYHVAPHRGLRGQSPLGRWQELERERFVPEPPDQSDIRVALGNPLERTLTKRGIEVCGNHYSSPELREHFAHTLKRKLSIRVDPEDIGAISFEVDGRWHEARSVHEDLAGVTLDAWVAQHKFVLQRYKDVAQLSLQTRRDVISSIQERRKQAELDRITPGSKTDTSAKIDWLEKNLFNGKSYEPLKETVKFSSADGPFGMAIKPENPPEVTPLNLKEIVQPVVEPEHPAGDWRLEDE